MRIRLGINCPFRTTLTPNSTFSDADMSSCCGGDNPALAVWHALEANSSPEAREGPSTNPDRDFDAEQGELGQDGPIWEQP